MKTKKVISLLLALSLTMAAITGCGGNAGTAASASQEPSSEAAASEAAADISAAPEAERETTEADSLIGEPFAETVNISLLNSKPEITKALEAGAGIFSEKYNVVIEVFETDSPGDVIAQRYASGDAPTIAILDYINVVDLSAEKILDLSDQPWCEAGGRDLGVIVNDKVYGMPLTVEGRCLLYNKTIIEELTGREFSTDDYVTLDQFSALVDELKEAGMEYPVVLNSEDWSIGQHFYQYIYMLQDGTAAGGISFLNDVHNGNTTFNENDVFNKVYDAMDIFIANNINQADPLAADYDLNASYVAEGEAAFWLNGTWAWPDFEPFIVEGMEYGTLAFPINGAPELEGRLAASGTKFISIDVANSTKEQQEAAKLFLNWLVFDSEGQNVLINDCGIVTAFTNIVLPPSNPFNVGLKEYIDKGMTVEGVTYMPSDHRSSLAANMQAYLDGVMSRAEVAGKLDEYWTINSPK